MLKKGKKVSKPGRKQEGTEHLQAMRNEFSKILPTTYFPIMLDKQKFRPQKRANQLKGELSQYHNTG